MFAALLFLLSFHAQLSSGVDLHRHLPSAPWHSSAARWPALCLCLAFLALQHNYRGRGCGHYQAEPAGP